MARDETLDPERTGNPDGVPVELNVFLLARWLEDAQEAQAAIRAIEASPGTVAIFAAGSPGRVLDYIGAQQRIVAEHMTVHDLVGQLRQRQDDPCTCYLLRCLALPYAGHPEYRDEWRVTE